MGQRRTCLNCGTLLTDAFCSHCGQRAGDMHLSLRDLLHELAAEHFGLDTKVARTLGVLARYPGRLTLAFIAGRRVRYLPPLRLYLSLSVLFFLASALAGSMGSSNTSGGLVKINRSGTPFAKSTRDSTRVKTALDSAGVSSGIVDGMVVDTVRGNSFGRFIKRRINQRVVYLRAHKSEAGQQMAEAFRHDLPDALFLLIPGLALALSVLYYGSHRYYSEHLVFALHFQAFAFLALTVGLIPVPFLDNIVDVAVVVYLFLALRTVYGQGIAKTIGKTFLLMLGYGTSLVMIMAAVGITAFMFA